MQIWLRVTHENAFIDLISKGTPLLPKNKHLASHHIRNCSLQVTVAPLFYLEFVVITVGRHSLVVTLSSQAVWVQDPPHGLPAAAAGSLQLQESRQGHSLEHSWQRRMRSAEIENKNIVRRGGVTCMYRSFSDVPFLPRRLLFWFSLG